MGTEQGGLAAGVEKEQQCPGSHWLRRLGRWWPLTTHPTCSDSALLLPTIHCAAGPTCHRQVQVQGPFAGKRATAGLHSKGSFTTSGKIARNPNFFLANWQSLEDALGRYTSQKYTLEINVRKLFMTNFQKIYDTPWSTDFL